MTTGTVIQFPAPPPRAVLQPSIHGRGVRNYAYAGELDAWHAPGIWARNEETKCAVDAAWIVERLMGPPRRSPPMFPGVPGAADRAREFARRAGLRPYQQDGAAFLAERDYAFSLDQMGLGKTAEALVACEARLSLGLITNPNTPVVLVLCPALAKRHWQREIKKWVGCDAEILEGLRPGVVPETRYIIANYDILFGARRKDAAGVVHDRDDLPGWEDTLAGRFLIVILDEAHMMRGRASRRSQAVKKICKSAVVVWGLSGTIVPNHIRDLWASVDLISGGLWGGYWDWAKKYCEAQQGQYGWTDTGKSNLDELQARMSFFMMGRSKDMVGLELPEKVREVYKIDVEMTAPTVHDAHEALGRQTIVAKALRATAKAKRSAVIAQAVEFLQARQKVIVFVYMREQADAVAKGIRNAIECPVACVHGDLSPEGRDAQAQVFRESTSPACFVATIDSVTMAISLVGADLVLYGDLVPEPWKMLQSEARAHRFGSTNRVLVRYLIAAGTVDETLAEAVIEKLGAIEQALGMQTDQQDLGKLFGGKTDETIIDTLFAKLRADSVRRVG